jgi:hypothetical protein
MTFLMPSIAQITNLFRLSFAQCASAGCRIASKIARLTCPLNTMHACSVTSCSRVHAMLVRNTFYDIMLALVHVRPRCTPRHRRTPLTCRTGLAFFPPAQIILTLLQPTCPISCVYAMTRIAFLPELLPLGKELMLDVVVVNFQVGSGGGGADAFTNAVNRAGAAFDMNLSRMRATYSRS